MKPAPVITPFGLCVIVAGVFIAAFVGGCAFFIVTR